MLPLVGGEGTALPGRGKDYEFFQPKCLKKSLKKEEIA